MEKVIKKDWIKEIYRGMLIDGFTTLDLKADCECKPFPITSSVKLSCDDGTHQEIQLASGEWDGKDAVLLWNFMGGKYVEYFIGYPQGNQDWWKSLWSDDVVERVCSIIESIVKGGQEGLEKKIKAEGIEHIHSLVLTEKRMEKNIRLPYSCAISFYGEVIAGVEEIKEYCKNQTESSSPYILKRSHDITLEDDDIGECETVRCTGYLICKDAETAKVWMKEFAGMRFSNCECVSKSWGCPPMICYVEGKRYMLLDYIGGYRG